MNARSIPWRMLGYVAAAALAYAAFDHGMSFIPGTSQWLAKRAEARGERLEAQVSTLQAEATGNAEIGQAVDTFHRETIVIREIEAQAQIESRSDPHAETPVAVERAARLSDHERRVCELAALDCSAIGAAGRGAGALPPDDTAGQPDAG